AAKDKPEEHSEPTRVVHTNGQTLVRLDAESQQHARLQVAELAAGSFKPELKSYGRVLEPAPLAVLVAEIASAAAALEASSKEFQRLKLLHSEGQNVSARALEAAEAATKRDQIALDVAQSKLLSGWGKGIASQPDLPAFVRSLTTLETALVRVDLPLGEALRQAPLGARIGPVAAAEGPTEATF